MKEKQKRYTVLHIPTASYLLAWTLPEMKYSMAIFKNKAKAGHGIEHYRKYSENKFQGYSLALEEDISAVIRRGELPTPYSVDNVKGIKFDRCGGSYHKDEFMFIPEELDDPSNSLEPTDFDPKE